MPVEQQVAESVLEARGISREFAVRTKGGRKGVLSAVHALDIMVGASEIVGVVGESGCGKSTLGRVLGGLHKPTAGTITYGGKAIDEMSTREYDQYRRDVQFVFQDPMASLDPRFTVRRILLEGISTRGMSRSEQDDLAASALSKVGLPTDILSRRPHEFSGGQKQRIGIARALIRNPKVIIADEPVAALDVSLQARVVNLLVDLQRAEGLSLLFISHNLSVVGYLADRVVVMYLGTIVEEGATADVLSAPKHPYTRALLAAVPTMGADGDEHKDAVISGELPSPLDPPPGCRFSPRCPFAVARCFTEEPVRRTVGTTTVACHRAEELPAW